jgi:hypothetical protein
MSVCTACVYGIKAVTQMENPPTPPLHLRRKVQLREARTTDGAGRACSFVRLSSLEHLQPRPQIVPQKDLKRAGQKFMPSRTP